MPGSLNQQLGKRLEMASAVRQPVQDLLVAVEVLIQPFLKLGVAAALLYALKESRAGCWGGLWCTGNCGLELARVGVLGGRSTPWLTR